jgi:hypothetical protein
MRARMLPIHPGETIVRHASQSAGSLGSAHATIKVAAQLLYAGPKSATGIAQIDSIKLHAR